VLDGGECITSRPGRFTPGKEPTYPFNIRLGGRQNRSGRFGEEKSLLRLSNTNPGPYHSRCTEYDVQTSLIRAVSVRIARASSEIQSQQLCTTAVKRSLVGLQPHGLESISMYQRDLVTIGNEPATPICELTAPTGLSEPEDAGKDNPSNES